MKPILIALFSSALLVHAEDAKSPLRDAELSYRKGIAAEKAGDPAAAKEAYTTALKLNPKHANARYRLGELRLNSKKLEAKSRESQFSEVILPKIELEDADLKESIEILGVLMKQQIKESDKGASPQFVIQDPEHKLPDAKVNLQLKNIPAKAALSYILQQTGAKARFDEYAVIILPAE